MELEFAVADITAKVQANRDEHEATYQEALKNFKSELVEVTAELADKARDYLNGDTDWDSYTEKANEGLRLRRPTHFLEHYDAALSMLALTSAETIRLDVHDYSRFVLDDWEWKDSFVGTTSNYIGGKFAR